MDNHPRFPRQTEISELRRTIVMVAMALGTFAIGTTEFVSMGMLPLISQDFGVREDTASVIISVYALGVVVGAPAIAALTGKIPRRRLILVLIVMLLVGNLLTALAPNLPMLLGARFLAGIPHGAYFAVGNLAAASMAPPGARGKYMAMIGMGLTVATILGVPAAQALGQAFGWHAAYFLVAAIAALTTGLLYFLMPHMTRMRNTDMRTELGALKNLQVWLTIGIGTVGFGGMFASYTYITWTMTEVSGLDLKWMWAVLMVYGVGLTLGNAAGGVMADRNLELGIIMALVAMAISSVLLYLAAPFGPIPATLAFFLVAFFCSTLVPSLQLRLVNVAGDAQTLANALNQSAFNIANATGAALAGLVVGAGFSYNATALAGTGLAVCACVVWALARRVKVRA